MVRINCYLLLVVLVVSSAGCQVIHQDPGPILVMPPGDPHFDDTPRELDKAILPEYRVEPPDILNIEATRVVPKPPYRLQSQDIVIVDVQGTLPDLPIMGEYAIEPGGWLNLGSIYGRLAVGGMSIEEAQTAVTGQLKMTLADPMVTISIAQSAGAQTIAGEHLVTPDGTVRMGTYGSVSVVGMTLDEAEAAVEKHLQQFLESPEIAVDVLSYNSKVFYIVTEGAGFGDQVFRFPITGNETVLDAISNVNGLTEVSSKKLWIARPTRNSDQVQILPIDWDAITSRASVHTNYQLLPGDRLFVAENKLVAFDAELGKLLAPFERIMGFSILTLGTVSRFSGRVLSQGGGFGGIGGGF